MSKVRKVVLLITPSREYTRGLLRGVAKYSRIQGLWAFYRPLDSREPKGKERLLPLMKTWDPDGILMREPHKIEDILAMDDLVAAFRRGVARISGHRNKKDFIFNHDEVHKEAA